MLRINNSIVEFPLKSKNKDIQYKQMRKCSRYNMLSARVTMNASPAT